ncbi:DNA polymerase B region [Gemmatirosa kalamazoonensis]|uniref:DNA-directed DNA polymerase n=1 Tax=Gemmatirosa kalamazoonensis TaxID=861299 RepID=W0RC28_9BACT|nr:DNA polymerase domain-containing protein [Gemmatirosa kalamazoonensis]AHG88659.1 DNA polymerase B region [Gemmatirosa kalamazoonensis]
MTAPNEDEWLWGWDPTPGIVSVWAEADGRAIVWRRDPETKVLERDDERFRPWLLLDRLDDLRGAAVPGLAWRELDGPGALRFLVSADDGNALTRALLAGASRRLGENVRQIRDLGDAHVLSLPPDEQYLVATGRTYFRGLAFDDLRRLQFDLETTGLDPARDRIFLVAVRHPDGRVGTIEARGTGDAAEADLIRRLAATIAEADPDVIENHNLHGFDLPFVARRAQVLGVPLALGRVGGPLRQRGARRGVRASGLGTRDSGLGSPQPTSPESRVSSPDYRIRYVAPGRELIDTLDATIRYDHGARELPGHGLKAVARHFGLAGPERELIRGDQIHVVYRTDPARVRRYATADVEEVAGLARVLGGAAFALARMAPRRYERLADAGAATGVIDPLLVRAYLRAGAALPAYEAGDGTPHSGAALHLFATGVARHVVKADVASLYPSLMRAFRIGPARDHLGALLAIVDRLVAQRLEAKDAARAAPAGSAERHTQEAVSAAMKIVVNSAYGYLAAGGELTRFADVHAANEVTRRGRETLGLMCRELAARGVTLLEADTDGVYFAVPDAWSEADERRVVAEVAALLPPLVKLEFEGRYAAMLSHEPKNYALLTYDGRLLLRGVAFRSSRAEPYGDAFLRRALERLLAGDVAGVRDAYLDTLGRLRARAIPTHDVSSRVRLTKTPAQYAASRGSRRELAYEALLASGRSDWSVGERVRVYRTQGGGAGVVPERDEAGGADAADPRDYDVEHYARVLLDTYAARLARGLAPEDFDVVFADPDQLSLFAPRAEEIRTVLTTTLS